MNSVLRESRKCLRILNPLHYIIGEPLYNIVSSILSSNRLWGGFEVRTDSMINGYTGIFLTDSRVSQTKKKISPIISVSGT